MSSTAESSSTQELNYYNGITNPVDDSSAIDCLDDPVREITDKFYSLGEVIKGQGLENGSLVTFGGYRLPNILAPGDLCTGDVYGVVSWAAHQQLFTHPATSSSLFKGSVEPFFGPTLSPKDPPVHTKFRAVMQRGFTPKQVENYKDGIARPVLERRFSQLKKKGKADLVREINFFFPFEIVSTIVGYEFSDIEYIAGCMDNIWKGNVDINAALESGAKLQEYATQLIARRREDPRDDYLSALLDAEIDGEKIDDHNLVGLVNHLLSGGIETTYRQTSMLVYDLLTHPDQLALVRENRDLIPAAVEETLRYDNIGGMTCRLVTEDVEICGTIIPQDSVVFTFPLSANRDPAHWENPHEYNIERAKKKHFTFAMGPHMCIGQFLARFMMEEYLKHFLDDFPNVRWDPDAEIPKPKGWNQRACTTLPIVWDAA